MTQSTYVPPVDPWAGRVRPDGGQTGPTPPGANPPPLVMGDSPSAPPVTYSGGFDPRISTGPYPLPPGHELYNPPYAPPPGAPTFGSAPPNTLGGPAPMGGRAQELLDLRAEQEFVNGRWQPKYSNTQLRDEYGFTDDDFNQTLGAGADGAYINGQYSIGNPLGLTGTAQRAAAFEKIAAQQGMTPMQLHGMLAAGGMNDLNVPDWYKDKPAYMRNAAAQAGWWGQQNLGTPYAPVTGQQSRTDIPSAPARGFATSQAAMPAARPQRNDQPPAQIPDTTGQGMPPLHGMTPQDANGPIAASPYGMEGEDYFTRMNFYGQPENSANGVAFQPPAPFRADLAQSAPAATPQPRIDHFNAPPALVPQARGVPMMQSKPTQMAYAPPAAGGGHGVQVPAAAQAFVSPEKSMGGSGPLVPPASRYNLGGKGGGNYAPQTYGGSMPSSLGGKGGGIPVSGGKGGGGQGYANPNQQNTGQWGLS